MVKTSMQHLRLIKVRPGGWGGGGGSDWLGGVPQESVLKIFIYLYLLLQFIISLLDWSGRPFSPKWGEKIDRLVITIIGSLL